MEVTLDQLKKNPEKVKQVIDTEITCSIMSESWDGRPTAESEDLKSSKCGFESHPSYSHVRLLDESA